MNFLSKILNLFGTGTEDYIKDDTESNEIIEAETTTESNKGWYDWYDWSIPFKTDSGVNITPESAMDKVGVVYACVDRRATALAKLPIDVYCKQGDERIRDTSHPVSYLLKRRPNKYQTPTMYKKFIVVSQLLWGYTIIYKKINYKGEIEELIPWQPKEVSIQKVVGRDEYLYHYRGKTYTEDEVIYIPYVTLDGKIGKPPLTVARESAGAVVQMSKHLNRFYKNGAIKQGALITPASLSTKAKIKLKQMWSKLFGGANNSSEPAVLDNGLDWKDISLPLKDAEFIESRRLTALDIAAIFNVPASSVGLATEKYSNLQEVNERWIYDVIAPDCVSIEEAHNYSCFLKSERNYYIKFNLAAGMRANDNKRADFYQKMISMGVLTINEVRALEDLNSIGEYGDKHYVSLNYTTLETLEQHERIKNNDLNNSGSSDSTNEIIKKITNIFETIDTGR